MGHSIVWPDEVNGPVFEYMRRNNRPEFPSEAVLILDTVPYPSPEERRTCYLAARLSEAAASRFDFEFVDEHPTMPGMVRGG